MKSIHLYRRSLKYLLNHRIAQLVIIIILLSIFATSVSPVFASALNFRNIALDVSLLLVLGAGVSVVMVTRNLDLSVGSVVCLSAMTVGVIGRDYPSLPLAYVVLSGIGVGLIVGLINGVVVAYLKVSSIIYTLGMLSLLRGLVYWIGGGLQVNSNDVRPQLVEVSIVGPFGLPWLVYIAIASIILTSLFLRGTLLGRSLYAVGSNPRAAELRGLPSRLAIISAFCVSGFFAGSAGVIYICRYGFVANTTGTGLELTVLAAVVIGGISIFGGSGSVGGTALGCLLLVIIANSFAITDLSVYWRGAVYGILIIVAVSIEGFGKRSKIRFRGTRTRGKDSIAERDLQS